MARTYHWGILGCGKIARKFSKDLQSLDNAHCYAVASRELVKAQDFADTFCFEKAYGTYLELVEDPAVDIVYIATPHAFHLAHSLLCLKHRKAVLCEKAFAMNHREVQQMVRASKEYNTFLMEAFWTRFQPQFLKVLELIKTQPLGALRFVKSDFMFNGPYDPENRLYNIGLGGGSLLDIGIYPVFYALMFLGKPDHIKTLPHFSPTGSEESIAVLFGYNSGATAILSSSFAAQSNNLTELCFENGYLKFERLGTGPVHLHLNGEDQQITCEQDARLGYHLEALHVMECLDAQGIESPLLSNAFSLDLMEILDAIRADAGIVYPGHD